MGMFLFNGNILLMGIFYLMGMTLLPFGFGF